VFKVITSGVELPWEVARKGKRVFITFLVKSREGAGVRRKWGKREGECKRGVRGRPEGGRSILRDSFSLMTHAVI